MSIEELFKSVIAALEANTAAVKLLESTLVGRSGKTPKEEKAESPKTSSLTPSTTISATNAQPQEVVSVEVAAEPEVVEPVHADENGDPVTDAPVAYETVRKLVLALAPTKRDAIKALNAKHGINNLKALLDKEDDFSTVNDQVKLEAVYADLQALEA